MTVLVAGQLIAERYELLSRIAVGGMGEVWEAGDTRLGRSVAVKILRPELSGDDEFRHRFRIEARTVASLDHPGIAHVHDYGEDVEPGGRRTAYLVMELVRGEPLSTLVARGPLGHEETLRIVEQAAWALHAAHERGFVHRDVKPGNILVADDGRVKITDFGIAKAANAAPVTRSGMVMGTAHYIAPEQATGGEAGPTGDVYSLGIVAYECLAGHRPFRGDSAVDVAAMQVRDAPPPLPGSVPAQVRALIDAVLVKDPAMRYATGREFAEAVAALRRGGAAPAPGAGPAPTPAGAGAAPGRRRRRWARTDDPGPAEAVPVPVPTPTPTPTPPPLRPAVEPRRLGELPPAGRAPTPVESSGGHAPRPPQTPATWFDSPSGGHVPRPRADPPPSSAGPRRYVEPAAPPAARPARDPAPDDPGRRTTGIRTPPGDRGPGSAAHAAPLNVRQRSASGVTLLIALFVLLTLAAVVVGYLVFVRGLGGAGDPVGQAAHTTPDRSVVAAGSGSVTGREGVLTGRTADRAPLVVLIIGERVR
ncbi:MAG: serine/threonine-protein kinase [Pseudonocardia sp.]